MKRCPRCGSQHFCVTAHVAQDWVVDENGTFLKSNNDCLEVTHFPDDEDIWDCESCGYSAAGREFNVAQTVKRAPESCPGQSKDEQMGSERAVELLEEMIEATNDLPTDSGYIEAMRAGVAALKRETERYGAGKTKLPRSKRKQGECR